MSLEKERALGLPQLGVRLFADSNSWNVNGKSQNCEADTQSAEQELASDNVAAQPSVLFLRLLRTKFKAHLLLSSLWQHGGGKCNVPTGGVDKNHDFLKKIKNRIFII